MFWNYVKISLRIFWRQRVVSLINLIGLSTGLAASFIILLFLISEISYDRFHKNGSHIYRIVTHDTIHQTRIAASPYLLGTYAKAEVPDIEKIVSVYFAEDLKINVVGDRYEREPEFMDAPYFLSVDSGFFEMFTYPVLQGDAAAVMRDPNAVAISEKMADRFFPGSNPIGETLNINHKGEEFSLVVRAVFKDFPKHSSIKAEFISGIDLAFNFMIRDIITTGEEVTDGNYYRNDWMAAFFPTFVLFEGKVDIASNEKLLNTVAKTYNPQDTRKFYYQSLHDIHLHSQDIFAIWIQVGDKKNLVLFSIIGLLPYL